MQHRCHSILIFFRTKTEQEGVLSQKNGGRRSPVFISPPLAVPHDPCAAMPKKKALGRTSEPRHMPSTVAPISRRSLRLCCIHKSKTQISQCWERCSNQPDLREIPLEVTPLSFGRRTVFGAYRGRRSKGLFSKKNMERRGQLHGDKD